MRAAIDHAPDHAICPVKKEILVVKQFKVEEVARLAEDGKKKIAVCAPAFSADCIETLEEINEEIRESFEEAGGEQFTYIPCLNDDDAHITALADVIDQNLKGWIA